jgi:type IV secretory pathway TrbD component
MIVPEAVASWPYRGRVLALASTGSMAPPPDPLIELAGIASVIGQLLLLVATAGSIAGLVARWRGSPGAERQQIKWFAYGALLLLAGVVLSFFAPVPGLIPAVVLGIAMGLALPVTIGIAILRYHLWDIDRIISRTVSYAIVSGLLAAVFVGLVLGLRDVLAAVTGASTLAVAASTLAVFALFQPLRRRVQRVVDRRFNRARYNAAHTVASLAGRLRDETELARAHQEVRTAILQALSPSSTTVWMRSR